MTTEYSKYEKLYRCSKLCYLKYSLKDIQKREVRYFVFIKGELNICDKHSCLKPQTPKQIMTHPYFVVVFVVQLHTKFYPASFEFLFLAMTSLIPKAQRNANSYTPSVSDSISRCRRTAEP